MKELTKMTIYNDEYEIEINRYLTYAQIQQICNAVRQFETWSERQKNIDLLLLYHATDMTQEEIESYSDEELLQSGLINMVKETVKNYEDIYVAIDYTESISKAVTKVAREMTKVLKSPDMKKKIDEVAKKVANGVHSK